MPLNHDDYEYTTAYDPPADEIPDIRYHPAHQIPVVAGVLVVGMILGALALVTMELSKNDPAGPTIGSTEIDDQPLAPILSEPVVTAVFESRRLQPVPPSTTQPETAPAVVTTQPPSSTTTTTTQPATTTTQPATTQPTTTTTTRPASSTQPPATTTTPATSTVPTTQPATTTTWATSLVTTTTFTPSTTVTTNGGSNAQPGMVEPAN